MAKHATLSASESKKWLTCPGSVALARSAGAGGSRGSSYARLGTAAHALASLCLDAGRPASDWLGGAVWMDAEEGCLVLPPGHELGRDSAPREAFPVDAGMAEAVQVYLDHCASVLAALSADGARAHRRVELRCDLSWVHPDMFGTADFVAWSVPRDGSPGVLHVVDYKHGAGVPVEVAVEGQSFFGDVVPENTQLLYYALGVAGEVGFNFREVHLTVVQPRCRHSDGPVRSYVTSVDRLHEFVGALRRGAARVEAPQPDLVPGPHCRWCKAASACPRLHEKAGEAAALDFADAPPVEGFDPAGRVPGLDDAQLAHALRLAPMLRGFLDALDGEAARRTALGRTPPGFKVVEGRSVRRWADPDAAAGALVRAGLPSGVLHHPPRMLSPAQVEKLREPSKGLGRREVLDLVKGLSERPPGRPKLVPEEDPRPALAGSGAPLLDAFYEDDES